MDIYQRMIKNESTRSKYYIHHFAFIITYISQKSDEKLTAYILVKETIV